MPQRQLQASKLPSLSVFLTISMHFTATLSIPPTSSVLKFLSVSLAPQQLSCCLSPLTYKTAYAPFKPNKSGQRLHPTYYRGCWHVVSRCLFIWYLQFAHAWTFYPQIKAVYNPEGRLPARGMAGSGSHPLTNIPYCCLP